jgi:hypothetical protein
MRDLIRVYLTYNFAEPERAAKVFLDEGGIFPRLTGHIGPMMGFIEQLDHMSKTPEWNALTVNVLGRQPNILSTLCHVAHVSHGETYIVAHKRIAQLVKYSELAEVRTGKPLIPDEVFAANLSMYPGEMISALPVMNKEHARKLCDRTFTPEFLNTMASTEDGLKLLIELSSIAGWANFTSQFVKANETRIRSVLDSITESNPELAQKLVQLLEELNVSTQKHAVQRTVEHDELSGRTAQCSVVNGISWDRGFVNVETDNSIDGIGARLYRKDAVSAVLAPGWRLPSVDDLMPLSDNPAMTRELQMGFSKTGFADSTGKIPKYSETACYAWCTDSGELSIYKVTSSDVDPYPDEVDPETCMAAIKPVKG